MRNYETTFIVDPVLSSDEIKSTLNTYTELLKTEGCAIVHIEEMGLRPLSYPINSRTTGVYYSVEFTSESGNMINRFELALHRDERIMRFLTLALDRYGVKYNEDKRAGKIGIWRKKREAEQAEQLQKKEKAEADAAAAKKAKSKPAKPAAPATTETATEVVEETAVATAEAPEAAVETVTETATEAVTEATPETNIETAAAPTAEASEDTTTNENTES